MSDKPTQTGTSKEQRLDDILNSVAKVFNDYGAHGLNITDISKQIGLTRSTLYKYVSDRDELIFRSYETTVQTFADYLRRADELGTNGLDKVLKFVELCLDSDGQLLAVLTDTHTLPEKYRSAIEAADHQNDIRLESFIQLGIADGSIRNCRTDFACHAIAGIVACSGIRYWVPSPTSQPTSQSKRGKSSDLGTVIELLERGIGSDTFISQTHFPVDATPVSQPLRNPFGRSEMVNMKHDYILTIASRLFNRHGVEGTSLEEVAKEIGVSKAVMYNYITNKNDLLVKCYNRALDLYERYADQAESVGRFGLEKTLMPLHLNIQAQMLGLSPLILISRTFGLENDDQSAIGRRAQAFVDHINALCAEGIKDGSIRMKDYKTAILASSGAVSWLPRKANPGLAAMPRLVADEYVKLFAQGLKKR